jgi:nucleoid-associated protein YgaU
MARETRIGLLVGLCFIVMFGLVLTELTGGNKTPPVPAEAVNDAARIAALPSSENTSPAVPAPGEAVARAGPPLSQAVTPAVTGAATQAPGPVQVAAVNPPRDSASTLAKEHALLSAVEVLPAPADSEELTASRETVVAKDAASPASAAAMPAPAAADKTYTVQPKDTLWKVAGKVYGTENAKEYRRVFEANKGTLKSESVLSAGQVLMIPPLPGTAPVAQGQSDQGARQLDMDQLRHYMASGDSSQPKATGAAGGAVQASENAVAKASRVYVVAPGDNLAKIARKMMGNDRKATVMRLYKANRDKLSSPQRLAIGMKLDIPG